MQRYRVIMQRGGSDRLGREDKVEINGALYKVGDVLDETDFRAGDPTREAGSVETNPHHELGELKSLLTTGHVELIEGDG